MRFRFGRSLLWTLSVSIPGVVVLIFLVTRVVFPEDSDRAMSLGDRFAPAYLIDRLRDGGTPLTVFIVILTVTIWLILVRALAPVRELSEHARRIGPASLNERLPADRAPREIAPLVDAFNASLDRLEDAWNAQRTFSAHAAHELRTPIAALRAQVESVLPAAHRPEAAAQFDRISRIMSQLLLLSESEQAAARRAISFDLAILVRDVAAEYAAQFVGGGRHIELEGPQRPCRRLGDPVLMRIAIRNLLDNALKHTPRGATTVVALDGDGVVCVRDNGPGLRPELAARAFEPFSRGDPEGGGAGLGLSIIARIARIHGGRVWLEPSPTGACFRLWIPDRQHS